MLKELQDMQQNKPLDVSVLIAGMLSCSHPLSAQTTPSIPYSRPDQYSNSSLHQSNLKSFGLENLANAPDGTFRLILHDWHRKPAVITVECSRRCHMQIVVTDGYGTYQQGKVETRRKTRITQGEYQLIRAAFEAANLEEIQQQDRARDTDFREGKGVEVVCMHAPHYFLEQKLSGQYIVLYRYCVSNYSDLYSARNPMIDLARKYAPKLTASAVVTTEDIAALNK